MGYVNKHKKKEIEKKGDLGLLFIIKKLLICKYTTDVATKLNKIIEDYGIKESRRIFYAALKRNPSLPEPYFFIKEGMFVGYSIDKEDFIPAKEFFNDVDKYIKKHKELKEKENRRFAMFEEEIKIKANLRYRFKYLDTYANTKDISNFFLYLHTKGFGKIVEDNSYISAVLKDKRYFVMRGYFEGKMNTLVKYSIDDEEISCFPMTFGYSYLGYRRAKKVFVVNSIYEIERFAKKEGVLEDMNSIEDFFMKNKFILLNGIDSDTRIFSGSKEKDKEFIISLVNDPITKKFLLDIENIQICDISKIEGIIKNENDYKNIKKVTSHLNLLISKHSKLKLH